MGKFVGKIANFDSFGAIFSHLCPCKREIWHRDAEEFLVDNINSRILSVFIARQQRSMLMSDIDIADLSVRPSVTFRYQMKTA